jgi:hypothetical protein
MTNVGKSKGQLKMSIIVKLKFNVHNFRVQLPPHYLIGIAKLNLDYSQASFWLFDFDSGHATGQAAPGGVSRSGPPIREAWPHIHTLVGIDPKTVAPSRHRGSISSLA